MDLGGYANRVARIDLTSGTVSYEEINEKDARLYIGARGLGVKYLYDNGPTVDATGPGNMLAFVNGPLTGSETTMSGRLAVVRDPVLRRPGPPDPLALPSTYVAPHDLYGGGDRGGGRAPRLAGEQDHQGPRGRRQFTVQDLNPFPRDDIGPLSSGPFVVSRPVFKCAH